MPDGSRCSFEYKGEKYFSLYNRYTYDGGRLNQLGQYYAAKELLVLLSETAINSHND